MKIKSYKTIFILLMTFCIGSSCKKGFLELTPKGSVIAETYQDYNLLLNNLILVTTTANPLQIYMGDEIVAIEPYFSGGSFKEQRGFSWEADIFDAQENSFEFSSPVSNLYTYNKVITEVLSASGGTEEQRKALQAEAKGGRAWVYFQLINYFGKPYNESTSASDPGFPIITNADASITSFSRSSIKEVFDFIKKDLEEAIPFLPVQVTSRTRMSKPAAQMILGKVLVYTQQYDKAIPYFDEAIANVSMASIPVRLFDYNIEFSAGGVYMPIRSLGPKSVSLINNLEVIYGKQFTNSYVFTSNIFVASAETMNLFDSSDLRLKFFSKKPYNNPQDLPNGFMKRMQGTTNTVIGAVMPELYLLNAECKARTGDLSGAVANLMVLREKRMTLRDAAIPVEIAEDKIALLDFIMEENIREFALLGYRWFNMRRLSADPLYANRRYTHRLYEDTGELKETYQLDNERFTLRIPQKVIDENPGMENNP